MAGSVSSVVSSNPIVNTKPVMAIQAGASHGFSAPVPAPPETMTPLGRIRDSLANCNSKLGMHRACSVRTIKRDPESQSIARDPSSGDHQPFTGKQSPDLKSLSSHKEASPKFAISSRLTGAQRSSRASLSGAQQPVTGASSDFKPRLIHSEAPKKLGTLSGPMPIVPLLVSKSFAVPSRVSFGSGQEMPRRAAPGAGVTNLLGMQD